MSQYDPNIHHRRSIRLQGYDYASIGLYFVTICTQNRECLLGEIKNGEMVLNDAGRMVERWYHETQNKFPDIVCHEMIVMPNHFHCIWENVGLDNASGPVGANLRVRPPKQNNDVFDVGEHTGAPLRVRPPKQNHDVFDEAAHAGAPLRVRPPRQNNVFDDGEHTGSPRRDRPNENDIVNDSDLIENVSGSPLSAVVGWFKTMSTNEYIRGVKQLGWPPFDRKLWQRNYYEHIIRNDPSLWKISDYIVNNPARWSDDKFYPNN